MTSNQILPDHHRQRGIALLTALVFLVVLTLLGIGVFSTTTSEEKMARNFRDKEIALQAAEAALNEAKSLINGSYDADSPPASPATLPKPVTKDRCFTDTPTGFTCNPNINAKTIDLFSGTVTGAPIGQIDATIGAPAGTLSPTIVGLYGSNQPRYLVIMQQDPGVCGATDKKGKPDCFLIVAQGRGRLSNTRVDLLELFTY